MRFGQSLLRSEIIRAYSCLCGVWVLFEQRKCLGKHAAYHRPLSAEGLGKVRLCVRRRRPMDYRYVSVVAVGWALQRDAGSAWVSCNARSTVVWMRGLDAQITILIIYLYRYHSYINLDAERKQTWSIVDNFLGELTAFSFFLCGCSPPKKDLRGGGPQQRH